MRLWLALLLLSLSPSLLCSALALALLLPATDFSQPLYEPCLQVYVCVSEVKHLRLLEAQNPGCLSDNDDDKDEQQQQ